MRKEDPGLAKLKDQQDGSGGKDRADGDKAGHPVQAPVGEGLGERIGHVLELVPLDHAGQDKRDGDIDDRANHQAGDNRHRHVPLRVACLFGRRRDRVKADVSEEDYPRRAGNARQSRWGRKAAS